MKKKTVECNLGIKVIEPVARHLDNLMKTLPNDKRYQYRRKGSVATSTEVAPTQRTDVSRITTQAMDRDFEIVMPDGIALESYRLNPIVLFGHNQEKPIGKALWIKPQDGGLLAKTEYPERPSKFEGEWLPDLVFSMVVENVLRGKSIGFLPLEIREPTEEEKEANPGLQQVIARSLLLEYSVVSVPSNPLALVEAIGKGKTLPNWQLEFPGRNVKRKKPVATKKPRTHHAEKMAEALDKINLDPARITELAVKRLAARWEV